MFCVDTFVQPTPPWRNARDLAEFRKVTDIKLVPPGPLGVLPKVIPSDVIPSCTWPACCLRSAIDRNGMTDFARKGQGECLFCPKWNNWNSCPALPCLHGRFAYGSKSRPSTPITHVATRQQWDGIRWQRCYVPWLGTVASFWHMARNTPHCTDCTCTAQSVGTEIGNQYATESEEAWAVRIVRCDDLGWDVVRTWPAFADSLRGVRFCGLVMHLCQEALAVHYRDLEARGCIWSGLPSSVWHSNWNLLEKTIDFCQPQKVN